MMHNEGDNLIRLHELRMEGLERWVSKLESKVDKIPWILFGVVCNLAISILAFVFKG